MNNDNHFLEYSPPIQMEPPWEPFTWKVNTMNQPYCWLRQGMEMFLEPTVPPLGGKGNGFICHAIARVLNRIKFFSNIYSIVIECHGLKQPFLILLRDCHSANWLDLILLKNIIFLWRRLSWLRTCFYITEGKWVRRERNKGRGLLENFHKELFVRILVPWHLIVLKKTL